MSQETIKVACARIRTRLTEVDKEIESKTRVLNAEKETLLAELYKLFEECKHPGLKEALQRERVKLKECGGCDCYCICSECGIEKRVDND